LSAVRERKKLLWLGEKKGGGGEIGGEVYTQTEKKKGKKPLIYDREEKRRGGKNERRDLSLLRKGKRGDEKKEKSG